MLVAGGMSVEEVPAFLDQVRGDVTNREMRVYIISKWFECLIEYEFTFL